MIKKFTFSPAHPGDLSSPAQPTDCFAIDFPGRALHQARLKLADFFSIL
jgi:hypothetical protein